MSTPKSRREPSLRHAVARETILFEEKEGIYYLRGEKLCQMLELLNQPYYADAVGLDVTTFMLYARQLLERGVKVGVQKGNVIRMLDKENPQPRPKVGSTTIGISPELLVGRRELARLVTSKAMRIQAMQELINTLKELMRNDCTQELAGYGTLYVIQVAQDMYEVDEELTTAPKMVVEALLVAAHQAGRMLRCQLVEPRGRRRKHLKATQVAPVKVSAPTTYGQLRLEI